MASTAATNHQCATLAAATSGGPARRTVRRRPPQCSSVVRRRVRCCRPFYVHATTTCYLYPNLPIYDFQVLKSHRKACLCPGRSLCTFFQYSNPISRDAYEPQHCVTSKGNLRSHFHFDPYTVFKDTNLFTYRRKYFLHIALQQYQRKSLYLITRTVN